MSSEESTLAVIGGGSVATSFLRQLAHHLGQRSGRAVRHVLVFDPRPQPGAGAAYQSDSACNLLNTRAAGMSALNSDPNHFYRWALSNESRWRADFPAVQVRPEAFLPRALFGQYMNSMYEEAVVMLAGQGVPVQHVEAQVTCVRQVADGYEITPQSGNKVTVDLAVLALGNQECMQFDYLRPFKKYFPTPYPCNKVVAAIDPRGSVGILGSNLGAIDSAVALLEAGHRGKILMVSRNGRLPSVRGEHNISRSPALLSRERVAELARHRGGQLRLREVAELVIGELELLEGASIDIDEILRSDEGPHRYLDAEIAQASERDRVWQAVVYGMNNSIDLIWHYLPDEDRRVFERKYKSQWLSYRVSFPLENARRLQKLLHADQLSVYGGCAEVSFSDAIGQFSINVADSRTSFSASMYADYLINATGYTSHIQQCASPLLRSLVASGQATSHEFGGIAVDFDTSRVLTRSGKCQEGLYALGSIASGTYFWTNAMNVNCRLADGVALQISDRAQAHSRALLPPSRVGSVSVSEPVLT